MECISLGSPSDTGMRRISPDSSISRLLASVSCETLLDSLDSRRLTSTHSTTIVSLCKPPLSRDTELDVLHPDHAPPPGKPDTHFT
eukprot:1824836-Prymnesium_polylepis.1